MLIIAVYILYIFVIIVMAVTAFLFTRRKWMRAKEAKYKNEYETLSSILEQYASARLTDAEFIDAVHKATHHSNKHALLQVILDYKSSWDGELTENVVADIGVKEIIKAYLFSKTSWKIIMGLNALISLNLLGYTYRAEKLLMHTDELVRHTAVEYLVGIEQIDELERMIMIISKLDDWYLEHFLTLFAKQQTVATKPLLELFWVKDTIADKVCILKILKQFHSPKVDELFKILLSSQGRELKELAAEYFLDTNPAYLLELELHSDRYPYVRALYFKAMQQVVIDQSQIEELLSHGDDGYQVIRRNVIATLVETCKIRPEVVTYLEEKMLQEQIYDRVIISVFELIGAIDGYIREFDSPEYEQAAGFLLTKIIKHGELGSILNFLSKSKNDKLNDKLTTLLLDHADRYTLLKSEDVVDKIREPFRKRIKDSLQNIVEKPKLAEKLKHIKQRAILLSLLVVISISPAIVFGYRHTDYIRESEYAMFLANLIRDFNYGILYYVGAINTFYLILSGLSLIGIIQYNNKKRAWLAGDYFKRKVVPPISLLAPCYNESLTVIESINSLLNIRYPRFEVVVINDGSKDDTLSKLIDYFQLEQIIPNYTELLKTEKVRSVYKSRKFKNIVVIDKENGGKADALNAGINIAKYGLFCAIDADTLIEGDSLVNVAAPFSYNHLETVATGGNVRVINNCEIIDGEIIKKALPKKPVERFQVLEYIRAFMGGRIGWSYINNLLIISGAFGLFKKKEAFAIGGYSTMKSREFHTVGEDMELAVSYHKQSTEQNKKYSIIFCHDASGWTEVPSDMKTLRKQRNRWHRGLLEVLVNNIQMMVNPKYRKVATSYNYFFAFELVGPWLEVLGYLFVIIAAILQILEPSVVIFLFSLSVLYGIIISLFSLYLEEKETLRYSDKELRKLITYAIIENFGFRQLSAFWRVGAYMSLLFNKQGWGFIQRKGFSDQPRITDKGIPLN